MPAVRFLPGVFRSVRVASPPDPKARTFPDGGQFLNNLSSTGVPMSRRYTVRWSRIPEHLALIASAAALIAVLAGRI